MKRRRFNKDDCAPGNSPAMPLPPEPRVLGSTLAAGDHVDDDLRATYVLLD